MFKIFSLVSFHYFAIALGSTAIFCRYIFLKDLRENNYNVQSLKRLFMVDILWAVCAGLWIYTGLTRAFGGIEKPAEFYLNNPMFHLKMGVFILIVLLEVYPMIHLIKWRIARKKNNLIIRPNVINKMILINLLQIFLTFTIPFIAVAMARNYSIFN